MSKDIIDVEAYDSTNAFVKFSDRFNNELPQNNQIKVKATDVEMLPPVCGVKLEKYVANFSIRQLEFKFEIITSCEREHFIRKVVIKPLNVATPDELTSALNYLQRKKDLKEVCEKLMLYAMLYEHRRDVMEYIYNEIGDNIDCQYIEDKGYYLKYKSPDNNDLFESSYKIWWNCRNFLFFDYICFDIDTTNEFYTDRVKKTMNDLLKPRLELEIKLRTWSQLITIAKEWISELEKRSATIEISDSDTD